MNRLKYFLKVPLRPLAEGPAQFINKPTKVTKSGLNLHRSNRAKEGECMTTTVQPFGIGRLIYIISYYLLCRVVSWQGCDVWPQHITLSHSFAENVET